MAHATQREIDALKQELESLRAERRDALAGAASQFGVDVGQPAAVSGGVAGSAVNWDEFRQLAHELAEELGQTTRDHPALGIGGAFILGVLTGRLFAR